jgi:excisionase family DNA binding protein
MGLLTMKEAATVLRTTVKQVWGLVHDGELTYVDTGRGKKKPRIAFDQQDLDAFIERRKRRRVCESSRTAKTTRPRSGSKGKRIVSLRDFQISERRKKLLNGIDRT